MSWSPPELEGLTYNEITQETKPMRVELKEGEGNMNIGDN